MNLPEQYLENMKELLGTDFDAYIESFNDSRLYGLRVNTMKISVEDFLKIVRLNLLRFHGLKMDFITVRMISLRNIRIILQDFITSRNRVR